VVILLAIGVAVVALTLIVSRELEEKLTRDAQGIDLVVGAKGSPLQLVLAGVYHVDVPPGNIPLASVATLRANRMIASVIPVSLGDSFRGYRIAGTEPAFIEHYGATLREGRLWDRPMEAVLGSAVAQASGLHVGATFTGSHGLAEGGGEHKEAAYTVAGILAPTGTVIDRLVVTPLDSVWAVHEAHHAGCCEGRRRAPRSDPRTGSLRQPPGGGRPRALDQQGNRARRSVAGLRDGALAHRARLRRRPRARVRAALDGGVGLHAPVALSQALEDRRYDLAILRTFGRVETQGGVGAARGERHARRRGDRPGFCCSRTSAAYAIGTWLPQAAPLATAAYRWLPEEWAVVALALGAGILAALWPAWRAARLDVAATLADG
jgi:putative ABC transport system permease protein